jgi:general secretion pathway protein M
MNKLKLWYEGLSDRDRSVVTFGGIALALIVLVGGLLMPLHSAVSSVTESNATKRQDLAWMRVNAPEIRAASGDFLGNTGEPAVVMVDRTARAAGLTDSLRGTQPTGNGVRVQLESASFDIMVTWLATLDKSYGFAVDTITVDRTAKPGLVNASITLTQSHT